MKTLLLSMLLLPLTLKAQVNYTVTITKLMALGDNCDGGGVIPGICPSAPQDPVFNIWTNDGEGNENTNCWTFDGDAEAEYGLWKDIQDLEIASENDVMTNYINIEMSGHESDDILGISCSPATGDDEVHSRALVRQFDLTTMTPGVVHTDQVGLNDLYYARVEIYFEDLTAGVAEGTNDFRFHLSPNPTTGKFKVNLSGQFSEVSDLHVIDMSGRSVYSQRTIQNGTVIDLTSQDTGIYTVLLSRDNTTRYQRIVIQ